MQARRSTRTGISTSPTKANPEVRVRAQDHEFWASAQVSTAPTTTRSGPRSWSTALYANYQTRTDRRIPLVRLVELRPA
jgi:hypothetical protein